MLRLGRALLLLSLLPVSVLATTRLAWAQPIALTAADGVKVFGEFGGENRTVAALGRPTSYDAALADLDAALAWGRNKANGAPLLVWGSSHSAEQVFKRAALNPADVAGLLASSPGEYLGKFKAVR